MLLGAVIFVYTDHKSLTYAVFSCHNVLCWLLYVEQYGPTIHHPLSP
ncbi:hypothetical protein ACHAXS_011030 [Conticribra weissflogii]